MTKVSKCSNGANANAGFAGAPSTQAQVGAPAGVQLEQVQARL